jgi:hypothetical protein
VAGCLLCQARKFRKAHRRKLTLSTPWLPEVLMLWFYVLITETDGVDVWFT